MDVRILTLSKQHYLDKYDNSFQPEYSCWGYYDGLSVKEAKNADEKRKNMYTQLFDKKSRAQISTIWYKTAEINETTLCGKYSQQEIGLFRSVGEDDDDSEDELVELFHQKDKAAQDVGDIMPFFAVAFLQLRKPDEYRSIREKIEKDSRWTLAEKANNGKVEDAITRSICYTTFDNDDLVVLLHGNSLQELEQKLSDIEKDGEVRYLHSVVGVSEQYLKYLKGNVTNNGDSLSDTDFVKGKQKAAYIPATIDGENYEVEVLLNEAVERIRVKMATSGEVTVLKKQYESLKKQHDIYRFKRNEMNKQKPWAYAVVHGHEDVVFELRESDVYTLLAMMVPGGFCTHQNENYEKDTGQSCVYNIETVFTLEFKVMEDIDKENEKSSEGKEKVRWTGYCLKLIKDYRDKMIALGEDNKNKDKKQCIDESLYAYYQLFLHTLNNLAQYEQFRLADDIFYLLYPSLRMFNAQMEEAMRIAANKSADESGYLGSMNDVIKEAFRVYLTAVTSVVYHTIHTDQMFLMIPGYSGAPYSIPIKLNLLYLWIVEELFGIFGENRGYSCILEPATDDRPRTRTIPFELEGAERPKNYLIRIRLSPRSLYVPRHLAIILSHEIGHYIGGGLRCRQTRFKNLKKVLAYDIAQSTFPKELPGVRTKDIKGLQEAYRDFIEGEFEANYPPQDQNLYGKEVKSFLKGVAYVALSDLWRPEQYDALLDLLVDEITKFGYDESKKYDVINCILKKIGQNAQQTILNIATIEYKINAELLLYQEVFSDLIPVLVLGATHPKAGETIKNNTSDFVESIRVSEGVYDISSKMMQDRIRVLQDLDAKNTQQETSYERKAAIYEDNDKNEEAWFKQKLRVEYAQDCYDKIQRHISDNQKQQGVNGLRELFKGFTDKEMSADELYQAILGKINALEERYAEEIERECKAAEER